MISSSLWNTIYYKTIPFYSANEDGIIKWNSKCLWHFSSAIFSFLQSIKILVSLKKQWSFKALTIWCIYNQILGRHKPKIKWQQNNLPCKIQHLMADKNDGFNSTRTKSTSLYLYIEIMWKPVTFPREGYTLLWWWRVTLWVKSNRKASMWIITHHWWCYSE